MNEGRFNDDSLATFHIKILNNNPEFMTNSVLFYKQILNRKP